MSGVRQAGLLDERAVFSGDPGPLAEADREFDAAEADLAVARGAVLDRLLPSGRPARQRGGRGRVKRQGDVEHHRVGARDAAC